MKLMEKLVEKAKNGNKEALEQLVQKIYYKLYKIAIVKLKNENDAQDIVQNTMEIICKSINNLRENKYFETWAIRILINECNKKFKTIFNKTDAIESYNNVPSEFNIDDINDKLNIEEIFSILDISSKEIMLLYFNQYTNQEIATIMQMNENTVKTRIKRAKEKLKRHYEIDTKNGGITRISKALITVLAIILVTTGVVYASIKLINNYKTKEKAEPIKWGRYAITIDANQEKIDQYMDKYDENVYISLIKNVQKFNEIKDNLNITFNDEDLPINKDTFEKNNYELLIIVIEQQPMIVHEVLPYSDRLEIGLDFQESSSKEKILNAFCIGIPKNYHNDNIILKYEKRPSLTETPKDATLFSSSKFYIENIEEFENLDLNYDTKQNIYYYDKLLNQNDYEKLVQQLGIVTEIEMTEERLKDRNIILVFQKTDITRLSLKRFKIENDIPTLYLNKIEENYGTGINGFVFTFNDEKTYTKYNVKL